MKTKSYITTSFGIAVGLCGVAQFLYYLFDGDPSTSPSLSDLIAVLTGVGLMAAKDWNASHASNNINSQNEIKSEGD